MAIKDIVLKLIIDGKESLVTLDKLDNKMLGIGKGIRNVAGAMGLAFGASEVIGFMKDSVAEATELNKVTNMLNATLKSTNFSAGLMSDELITLAENLEVLSNYRFDDKEIINAEGMLLTFKRINEEAFPDAIRLAMDLSVRFEQDLTSSIKQVGKALDDPTKGITALRKAGILFTEAQQEQIKALVKTNDLLGAQRLILTELESQVGGSAAASVDGYTLSLNRLNKALEGIKEIIGFFLTDTAIGAMDLIAGLFRTGSIAGAVMYMGAKRYQDNKVKSTTFADISNEARNKAKQDIEGKTDADIKKLIASTKLKYNASFMGLDSFGNVIDPEGTLKGLEAKLSVYESAIVKTEEDITDAKKKELEKRLKDALDSERKFLDWKLGVYANRNELKQKQREKYLGNFNAVDVPAFDPLSGNAAIKDPDQLFAEMENSGKVAISGLMGMSETFWQSFMMDGRQAKDGWDALWLSFKNSALQQIGEILSNNLFAELTSSFSGGSSKGSFLDDLFGVVTSFIPFLADGGVVTRPTIAMVGETGREAIIPLDRFNGGMNSGVIERKLDQVISAFENKQFDIDMYKIRSVNKRIDDLENRLRIK